MEEKVEENIEEKRENKIEENLENNENNIIENKMGENKEIKAEDIGVDKVFKDLSLSKLDESRVEAILFASGKAVSLEDIAESIGKDLKYTKNILSILQKEKEKDIYGVEIVETDGFFQMCSKKEFKSEVFKATQKLEDPKLTPTAMEVLSIIAYNQNISRPEISNIRGVSSDAIVNRLLEYGLIEETGKKDLIGKPMGFGTTNKFLFTFGIKNLSEMPPLPEINEEDL